MRGNMLDKFNKIKQDYSSLFIKNPELYGLIHDVINAMMEVVAETQSDVWDIVEELTKGMNRLTDRTQADMAFNIAYISQLYGISRDDLLSKYLDYIANCKEKTDEK